MAETTVGDHHDVFPQEDAATLVAWLRGSGDHWAALGAALHLADWIYHQLTPAQLEGLRAADAAPLSREALAVRLEEAAAATRMSEGVGAAAVDWRALLRMILQLIPLFL